MKRYIVIILLIFASPGQVLFAQSLYLDWQTCLGGSSDDYGNFMKLVVGDQVIGIVGRTDSDDGNLGCSVPGNTDAFLGFLDTAGTNLSYRCYGGSRYEEFNSFVEMDPTTYDKFLVGRTNSNDGDVSGNHGSFDAWLVKTRFNGITRWQKCLGGTGWEDGFSIISTSDGNLLMAGITSSDSIDGQATGWHGGFDGWLVKMDTAGNVLWQKCYGGSGSEYFYSVIETYDGSYVVSGFSNSNDGDVTGNYGSSDYWILKVDPSGNIIWQKSFGGSTRDEAYNVIETLDSNLLINGSTYSHDYDAISTNAAAGSSNILLVKLDQTGNKIWSKCYGSIDITHTRSIIETQQGNLYFGGEVETASGEAAGCNIHGCCDAWILSLDSTGNILNQQCFGSNSVDDGLSGIIPSTQIGHYYFLGQAGSNSGDVSGHHGGNSEIWIAKIVDSVEIILNRPLPIEHELTIYPNPFSDYLTITPGHNFNLSLVISNYAGQVIYEQSISGKETFFLATHNLSAGIYFARIISYNRIYYYKLIKY